MKADPSNADDQVHFRGTERWTHLASGLASVCLGIGCLAVAAPEEREAAWTSLALFSGIGLWNLWIAVHNWGRPYVRFDTETLIVHAAIKPQYISRSLIESFSDAKFWTVLKMKDGTKVRLSHLPFINSREVRAFQHQLRRYLAKEETI